jgi:RHS repeat-associated protein
MQEGHVTAGYNSLNQMVMVAGTSNWIFFGYDPLGRRVKQWTGGLTGANLVPEPGDSTATYFYYDGWNLIQEGPSAAVASRNYIHGARVDEIVKQITPPNQWERYFHYDARGHCSLQTDAGGNIVEQYDYDAFGQPYFYDWAGNALVQYNSATGQWDGYSPWGNRFLFTGREWLSDNGTSLKLYDYRNRMYQPELGRFMSPDSKHFAAGDYNLYRYCHNDPVNSSDPTGMAERILEDFQWKMNCFFDGGNSFQGSYAEFMNRSSANSASLPNGNYNDPNIKNHIRAQEAGGVTEFSNGDVDSGVARPTLNWWVQKEHADDKTILGELEHVSRHLWSAESGDAGAAIRKFNANPNAPDAKLKLENARQVEKIWQLGTLHGNPNRHDLNKNPKLWEKMTPTEIQNAIRNVTPMEDPRSKYLGY